MAPLKIKLKNLDGWTSPLENASEEIAACKQVLRILAF
jgi:hypothetical protein